VTSSPNLARFYAHSSTWYRTAAKRLETLSWKQWASPETVRPIFTVLRSNGRGTNVSDMAAARILIADDFPALRRGVRAILEGRVDTEVCGEAEDGEEAVEKAIALKPDLIVLDISMPRMDGFEAARRILAVSRDTPILIFSMHLTSWHVNEAKKVGCRGYVSKTAPPESFLRAIQALLRGETFFPENDNKRK
jgi:CheY-like chemotaxis protein